MLELGNGDMLAGLTDFGIRVLGLGGPDASSNVERRTAVFFSFNVNRLLLYGIGFSIKSFFGVFRMAANRTGTARIEPV